jgi:hypothetical protein
MNYRQQCIKQMVGERIFTLMRDNKWVDPQHQSTIIQGIMMQHTTDHLIDLLYDHQKCKQVVMLHEARRRKWKPTQQHF